MLAKADIEQGREIHTSKCIACRGAGLYGTPKLDETANWTSRITKGMGVMTANAISGIEGNRGYMPPGGISGLKDEEVTETTA